jgi:hypothetical protein
MKKLLFIPVAFALVAPLATITNNLSATASAVVPTTSSSATPTTKSTSQATFAALTSDWHHYRATDGSYSAKFPGQPSESVQPDESVEVMYEDRANNRTYLMQSVKLSPTPSQVDDEKVEVEKVLDAIIASQSENGNTVTDLQKISLNGLKGREITVQTNDGTVMKMRAFLDPKVPALYMAIVGAENGNLDFPEAQAFLNSVSIAQK